MWTLRRKSARKIPDAKSPRRRTLLPAQDDRGPDSQTLLTPVERILGASRYLHDVSREC
jgi:hypothetical protein